MRRIATVMLAGAAMIACGDATDDAAVISDNQALTWEEFRATVYQEPESGVFIVNGDEPIEHEADLRAFHTRVVLDGALIVDTVSGRDNAWDSATAMNLTYCVSQRSFGGNYARVVAAMDEAAADWEAIAAVDFVHQVGSDGNCSRRTNVVFDVQQVQGQPYLARAFFPDSSRRNRNILVDTSTYIYDNDPSDPLTLVGILRHELGHALGFRHEHTRPEAGACYEDDNWRALTGYDSASVMHYPQCNGTNSWALNLTATDAAGAEALYGAPGSGGGGDDGGGGDGGGGDGGGAECLPKNSPCSANADCCSLNCGRKRGQTVCK